MEKVQKRAPIANSRGPLSVGASSAGRNPDVCLDGPVTAAQRALGRIDHPRSSIERAVLLMHEGE